MRWSLRSLISISRGDGLVRDVCLATGGTARSVDRTVGVLTFTGSIFASPVTACALSNPRRYSDLQANTWLGLALCRRATVATEAPWARLS